MKIEIIQIFQGPLKDISCDAVVVRSSMFIYYTISPQKPVTTTNKTSEAR